MNREQAEHILDAYLEVTELGSTQEQTANTLREVILDAMTEYKSNMSTGWQGYGITLPATSYPTDWDGSPKVTCTGIDPAFTGVTANGNQ